LILALSSFSSIKHTQQKYLNYSTCCFYVTGSFITRGAVSSIILDLLIVPEYGKLFYQWSVYLPRWDISPRTLNETAHRSPITWYL